MHRKISSRLLLSAATLAALVAAVALFAGSGFARGTAAAANYAPQNTTAPSISGTAAVGSTLNASNGSWTSQTQPTFSYQWQRCDSKGNACAAVKDATGSTYKIQSDDSGSTLRVSVTAHNSDGTTTATSDQTDVVGAPGPSGGVKLPSGKTSVPAASVSLPDRLLIDGVQFQPSRLSSRATFTARFHVSDTDGNVVRGALVYALGLPYSWVKGGSEVSTDQEGWATVQITPTAKLPISRGHALVVFVRARVQGQDVLAGTSSRRLVQVTTG